MVLSFLCVITFYEYEIKDFCARVECKIFGGELKSGDCNLYCVMPEK